MGSLISSTVQATIQKGAVTMQSGAFAVKDLFHKGAITSTVQDGAVKGIENGAFKGMVESGAVKTTVESGAVTSMMIFSNTGFVIVAILLVLQLPDSSGNIQFVLTFFKDGFLLLIALALAAALACILLGRKEEPPTIEEEPPTIKLDAPTRLVMVGNPGSGKSTLLNGLVGKTAFESGNAFDGTLTRESQAETDNDENVFIDTPGLSDFSSRDVAAQQITMAIRENNAKGNMKLVFLVTTDSGRVRATDSAMMNLVLNALPPTTPYGIIVNKLEPGVLEALNSKPENLSTLIVTLNQGRENKTTYVHLNEYDLNLGGKDNVVPTMNEMNAMIAFINFIPFCDASDVKDVVSSEMKEVENMMNELLYELEKDKEKLNQEKKKMEKMHEDELKKLQDEFKAKKAVDKEVGPIYSNIHAPQVVNRWLAENPGWEWNGHWISKNGTSYAGMVRNEN